jgi:hypothetical protein
MFPHFVLTVTSHHHQPKTNNAACFSAASHEMQIDAILWKILSKAPLETPQTRLQPHFAIDQSHIGGKCHGATHLSILSFVGTQSRWICDRHCVLSAISVLSYCNRGATHVAVLLAAIEQDDAAMSVLYYMATTTTTTTTHVDEHSSCTDLLPNKNVVIPRIRAHQDIFSLVPRHEYKWSTAQLVLCVAISQHETSSSK